MLHSNSIIFPFIPIPVRSGVLFEHRFNIPNFRFSKCNIKARIKFHSISGRISKMLLWMHESVYDRRGGRIEETNIWIHGMENGTQTRRKTRQLNFMSFAPNADALWTLYTYIVYILLNYIENAMQCGAAMDTFFSVCGMRKPFSCHSE